MKFKGIKIKIRQDGSIKGEVYNNKEQKILESTVKNEKFSQIEIKRNNEGEPFAVIHRAWSCLSNFYHEDMKLGKLLGSQKIDEAYNKRKLKEKQSFRSKIKNIISKHSPFWK
ncbi:hypothetical protein KJ743_03745 [Patescibacteria group bacterium]|nr:hypothetical protein [Patescibacteria group bacterium]